MLQLCRLSSQPIGGNYTVISQFLRKNMCERVWASFRAEEGGLRRTCSRRKTKGRGGNQKRGLRGMFTVCWCEIRCVTASANNACTNTTSTFYSNVAPRPGPINVANVC